jgi:hypothetical protein
MYMADSRMIAGVIGIPKVKGSARTMPITAVRPGSTATSMPATSPTTRASRLAGSKHATMPPANW